MAGNLRLYPWFQFLRCLLFWQATWFLYFQGELSAASAILLFAVYDVATTVLEVPSGYMSDRIGRRPTLIVSTVAATLGTLAIAFGDGFVAFAVGQVLLGAGAAFVSGTDSALLYESLAREGRQDETEDFELRAWRASFAGFAFSAVLGGALAMAGGAAPFWASVATAAMSGVVAWRLVEPPHLGPAPETSMRLRHLRDELAKPILLWLLTLSVAMYSFSHIPFVFGQPLILETLNASGDGAAAPLLSGAVSALMMTISVGASWVAPRLRAALGLGGVLLLAFSMQVGLVGALMMGESLIVVAFLLFRMAPNALSRPFIVAAIQPELSDDSRATFLSLQSLGGRLVLAASLAVLSVEASAEAEMSYDEIRTILGAYLVAGLVALAILAATVGSLRRR